MGIFTAIQIALWISLIASGVYGIAKGYFYREREKTELHEPKAYRKWVRLSSAILVLGGLINILWSILDAFNNVRDWTYVILILATVALVIVLTAVSYACIVKRADKKAGIESEIDRILKGDQNKKS